MEFFVAGGDASEGLELGEGVFDAVAFAVDVLVKGGRDGSSWVQGYDGDAAELVHISADGVAVVALVHDGKGAGAQMALEQGFGLNEVGDVRAGEHEAQRITERVTGQMDLGGQAGAGAAHRMRDLPSGRVGCVRVYPHRSAVDHQVFIIPRLLLEHRPDRRPQTAFAPRLKPPVSALPRPKRLRQIPPRRSRSQYPQDRLDPQPNNFARSATPLRPDLALPVGLNFLSPSQSPSARTNLACWFTTANPPETRTGRKNKYSLIEYFRPIHLRNTA